MRSKKVFSAGDIIGANTKSIYISTCNNPLALMNFECSSKQIQEQKGSHLGFTVILDSGQEEKFDQTKSSSSQQSLILKLPGP